MNLIVCGEALWISCGTWIAFWNGFIGASVAAAAGALVALVVVRLTNAQQRHGVERTIEVAAVADFVAAVEELEWAARYRMKEPKEFDAGEHILRMRAAIARLKMARPESREIADIAVLWPEKLHNLVVIYRVARLRKMSISKDVLLALQHSATKTTISFPLAVSESPNARSAGIAKLKETDAFITSEVERFEAQLLAQFPDAPVRPKETEEPSP